MAVNRSKTYSNQRLIVGKERFGGGLDWSGAATLGREVEADAIWVFLFQFFAR